MRAGTREHRLLSSITAMACDRLGSGYALVVRPVEACASEALHEVERTAMTGAGPRRWATFRAGRSCARAALMDLGGPPIAIPRDPSGMPIWPAGFIGSISHTDEVAAAVVAHSPPVRGLGLDLEGDEPLDDASMLRLVCRPEELLVVEDISHPANLQHGKLLFVAKEAVYKVYRSFHDTILDFHDVSVSLDESAGTFRATFVDPYVQKRIGMQSVFGNFARAEGLLAAIAFCG